MLWAGPVPVEKWREKNGVKCSRGFFFLLWGKWNYSEAKFVEH